jgi:hypothetical protein
MLPHLDTVCMLSALEHEERLQEAAKERVAASAQASKGSSMARTRTASRIAAAWLSGLLTLKPRLDRGRLTAPLTSGHERPARRGGEAARAGA